jgi:hypothetical protein
MDHEDCYVQTCTEFDRSHPKRFTSLNHFYEKFGEDLQQSKRQLEERPVLPKRFEVKKGPRERIYDI